MHTKIGDSACWQQEEKERFSDGEKYGVFRKPQRKEAAEICLKQRAGMKQNSGFCMRKKGKNLSEMFLLWDYVTERVTRIEDNEIA